MSQIAMTIIDADRAIHGEPHGSFVEVVVAALAAEPETIDELAAALARFVPPNEHRYFAGWSAGVCTEPYDAGICIVDLAARLVVAESTYSLPGPEGTLTCYDRRREQDVGLRYHVSGDWRFSWDMESWEGLAEVRRRERMAAPPLDVRQALYGQVAEFIAKECLAARSSDRCGDWTPPSGWTWRALPERARPDQTPTPGDAIAEIHARWLTTPREDLRGQAPRDVLLAKHDHIGWDAQERCEQWSMLGECPPGLSPESAAFRFGGFGTHEIVLYYELVRHLIGDCWDHVAEPAAGNGLSEADEIARLRQVQGEWLNSPECADLHGRTPASVIERERLRLPEGVTGQQMVIDDDCPLCQMMADDFGPMFWHLDGCNMDDEFPFSFHQTRASWDEERRNYEEFNRKFNEDQKRRQAVEDDLPWEDAGDLSIWSGSYSEPGAAAQLPVMGLFGIGAHLGELGGDLKALPHSEPFVKTLNRQFGNLRAAIDDPSAELIDPVVERFSQELTAASELRPDLAEKCADLERQLREFAKRWGDGECWDDSIPF